MKWRTLLATVVIGACITLAGSLAHAQQFPTKPIEDSVWAAAGGGTDTVNRLIARAMEKELGGSVVVVNRTGGGGAVAMSYVWQRPHDGYSWLGASEQMQSTAVMGFHTTKTQRLALVHGGRRPGIARRQGGLAVQDLRGSRQGGAGEPGQNQHHPLSDRLRLPPEGDRARRRHEDEGHVCALYGQRARDGGRALRRRRRGHLVDLRAVRVHQGRSPALTRHGRDDAVPVRGRRHDSGNRREVSGYREACRPDSGSASRFPETRRRPSPIG